MVIFRKIKAVHLLLYSLFCLPSISNATSLYVNSPYQRMYENGSGWIYKYRLQVTNSSTHAPKENIPHFVSVRDEDGAEIPFASSNRRFLLKGATAKIVDVYINEGELKKNTIICVISDAGGASLGSCSYLRHQK